jgi:excisionase family DNA binding protein
MGEKRCYSVGEIQHILGICKTTAYNLIKENQFRSMLIGGKYVISKKSFDEWLDGEINMSTQEQTQSDQKPEEKQERQEGQMEQPRTDAQKEAQATVDAILEKYGYYRK